MKKNNSRPWWKDAVIYEVYPRSFKDSDGDGIGDLQGIIEKLDYLNDGTEQSLGIDTIWIGPVFPSPMADFGYDVSNYLDINPLFGDLATFDKLLVEAHKRGIAVVIDYVPNHTSDQHPWFIKSRSNRENPKRDWYIWRDPQEDGSVPNNWGSEFGGSAWEWDEHTKQYYFHQYLKDQPDLNWRNPEVKKAMLEVIRFWMRRGVDGLRMDVVGMIYKHPEMPDQPQNPEAPAGLAPNDLYARQLHVYDQDQEEGYEVARYFRKVVEEFGSKCILAEINYFSLEPWVKYYGLDGSGYHLPLYHGMLELPWDAEVYRQTVESIESMLPPRAWPNYVLGNHDVLRLASRVGDKQARVAAMMLLTLRGTPILYYGDELGMRNGVISVENTQDPWGINIGQDKNRDLCRTPMPWNSEKNSGFSSANPWLPTPADYKKINVEKQREDPLSILNLYRELIWYRKATKALQAGRYQSFAAEEGCFAFIRQDETDTFLIYLNFIEKEHNLVLPENSAKLVLSTYMDRQDIQIGSDYKLRPHEGLLIKLPSNPSF